MRGLVVACLCICVAVVHAETSESSAFAPTIPNKNSPPGKAPEGMVWIPGGEFSMGASTSGHGTEEMPMASNDSEPVHRVYVDGFWMDATPVTNEQFEKFVKATGYVTIAERTPTKEEFPTAPAENLVAGSVVFAPTDHEVALNDHYQWWSYVKGANWMANTWQGKFPVKDAVEDGYAGISPVKSFPPNGYGLYDIAGNVWEWCSDWYRSDYYETLADKGGVARNPQGPDSAFDPAEPNEKKRVHRGGSFLCNEQYCSRYIVGTRGKGEVNTGTNHLGFRCVRSPENVAQRSSQN